MDLANTGVDSIDFNKFQDEVKFSHTSTFEK